jgi:hypothetical protein
MNIVWTAALFPALLLIAGLASCAPANLPIARDAYALIIGISNYKDANLRDLTYTENDRVDIGNLLRSQGWTVRDDAFGEGASYASIRSAIEDFFEGIPEQSTALIYFSGHGTFSEGASTGNPVLVPYDFSYSSWGPLIGSEVLSSWVNTYVPSRNIIIIIDACYSGGFVTGGDSLDSLGTAFIPDRRTVDSSALLALGQLGEMLARNSLSSGTPSPIVLSAAGPAELSWESATLGNGVFTYYLMESATKGDSDGDGYVTATEAYSYAARALDLNWNYPNWTTSSFYPHISGGLRDLVLFEYLD